MSLVLYGISNTRFFVNIVDIAVLADTESTLCWHHISICSLPLCPVHVVDIVYIAILTNIDSTLCLHCAPSFLFSTSRYIDNGNNVKSIQNLYYVVMYQYCIHGDDDNIEKDIYIYWTWIKSYFKFLKTYEWIIKIET